MLRHRLPGVIAVLALIVVVVVVVLCAAGWAIARRIDRRSRDAVERVRVQAQIRQTSAMVAGPRREVALLRQRLAAQLRAARVVLEPPGGQVFRADAASVLAEVTTSAAALDAALAAVGELTEEQQRDALPTIQAQVDQLIATSDTACRTLLRTRAETRSGQLDALAQGVDFEAASLAEYERERNELSL